MMAIDWSNYENELGKYGLVPVTGVLDANGAEDLFSYTEIDFEYEKAHVERAEELVEEGMDEEEAREVASQELEEFSSDRVLYGGWKKDSDGDYVPDIANGEEFSAIYNREEHTIQVVASRYVTRCADTSPCYPGQGDIDSYGRTLTYCLPWLEMREGWLEERNYRMCSIRRLLKVVKFARGEREELSKFECRLFGLMLDADMENIRKLYKAYPGIVRAVCIYLDSHNRLVDELK